jgi:hypothetical protein
MASLATLQFKKKKTIITKLETKETLNVIKLEESFFMSAMIAIFRLTRDIDSDG